MSQKAAFQLENYLFSKVNIDIDKRRDGKMIVDFVPSGIFYEKQSEYELKFVFKSFYDETGRENPYVEVECLAMFKFEDVHSIEDIPSFFYRNAIAILFPYVRAFVSMVTLQANLQPVVIPTFNLSDLEHPLRESTITK